MKQIFKIINESEKVIWPPNATQEELSRLASQRNLDIWIKGKTWPIKEFEEKFANFISSEIKYTISYNSGTSWLISAYFAIWIQEWDEVIWPALTYHAALSPVFVLWWIVKLCDVDLKTRCIIPEKIEELITDKTKAITVVHQWWYPCDMEKIMKIAKKHNLYIIEDCSHAHGSKFKWKSCWTFWDVAIFSLQTNKAIFCWEWWILLTSNVDIYERATLFWHYRDRSKMEIKSHSRKDLWATWYWLKLRMSPFNAIVWIYSLENFIKNKESKHKCLKYLNERLKEVKYINPLEIDYDNIDMWAWYWFKPIYNWSLWISTEKLVSVFEKFNLDISIPSWWSLINYRLYTSENNLLYRWIKSYKNIESNLPNSTFLDLNSLSFPTFYDWENHKNIIDKYIDILIYIWENITNLANND